MSNRIAARVPFILRESYRPSDNVTFKELTGLPPGLTVWTWEDYSPRLGRALPMAVAFMGRSNKPTWFHSFKDEGQRQRKIDDTIAMAKTLADAKIKRQEERKQFQHGLQVGDILVSSWGYDQTNIDFYQVVAVYGKAIGIREIGKRNLGSDGHGSDSVVPVPNSFDGPELKKIPGGFGGSTFVKINSFASAYKWNGKPQRETSFGWGH